MGRRLPPSLLSPEKPRKVRRMAKVGRPLKFKSAKKLKEKIDEYFDSCFETEYHVIEGGREVLIPKAIAGQMPEDMIIKRQTQIEPMTITGLAVYPDTSRETLLNYEGKKEFFDTINRAKEIIKAFAEKQLFVGKNPAGVIFNMKNNWGWKDSHEVTTDNEGIQINIVNYGKHNDTP